MRARGIGRAVRLVGLLVLLSGCSAGVLPSMRYCDKVEYVRDGGRIVVKAECRAPIGGVLGGA